MTVSPWLTFEKLKELDEAVSSISSGSPYVVVNSTGTLPNNTGTDAIAIGRQSSAFQDRVVAIGDFAVATSTDAISIGTSAQASSSSAIAIGEGASAGGTESVSLGFGAICSTANSGVSIGSRAEVLASGGIAIGGSSDITGSASNAISIGINSTVSATDAVQIGSGTNNAAETMQYLSTPIANSSGLIIPGPFADDTAASSGGVGIGNPYYTASGAMQVRLT